ncbi:Fic family protein [Arthrobacter pigmenti]
MAERLQQGSRLALDVVANVRATEDAITEVAALEHVITTADIEHLQHVIEPSLEHGVRTGQNWVGDSGWGPLRSEFVPSPESEVGQLVEDLARFISTTEGNPVVRAAIAHAQFETIHPFISTATAELDGHSSTRCCVGPTPCATH